MSVLGDSKMGHVHLGIVAVSAAIPFVMFCGGDQQTGETVDPLRRFARGGRSSRDVEYSVTVESLGAYARLHDRSSVRRGLRGLARHGRE
jgi:hypothetical protein